MVEGAAAAAAVAMPVGTLSVAVLVTVIETVLAILRGAGKASAEAVSVCVMHGADIYSIYLKSRYIGKYFHGAEAAAIGSRHSAAWVANIASWS